MLRCASGCTILHNTLQLVLVHVLTCKSPIKITCELDYHLLVHEISASNIRSYIPIGLDINKYWGLPHPHLLPKAHALIYNLNFCRYAMWKYPIFVTDKTREQ